MHARRLVAKAHIRILASKIVLPSITLLVGVILAGQDARGQTRFWNAGIGDWTDSANWQPASHPGPGIPAEINNGGTAQVMSGAVASVLYLGRGAGTTGNLSVLTGGGLTTGDTWVGDAGTGNATVKAGSWIATNFEVGDFGTGTVNLTSGGTLITSGRGELGLQPNSSGTVTLDGTGTKWTDSSSTLGLDVGLGGTGTLSVTNGAAVLSQLGRVGVNSGATGIATIDAGSWTSNSTLSIGDTGKGTFTIQNAGTTTTTSSSYIGRFSNSAGTATVTGLNSKWSVGQSLFVGNSGTGTLHIDAGGTVTSPTSGSIGELAGSVGLATINGPSKWTTNGTFTVGNSGKGTLSITGGGLVENMNSFFAAAIVGRSAGSEGVVTIADANSVWKHRDRLEVGSSDKGKLTMSGGGTVVNVNDNYVYIGRNTGSDGTVNVGAGSTWVSSTTADLYIADFGKGKLNLTGGTVQSKAAYLGNSSGSSGTAVVDGASTWTNTGQLYIGNSGTGGLQITNGGTVVNTQGYLGFATGTGGATVTGTGAGGQPSKWTNNSDLSVGYSATGTLNITGGGIVEVNQNSNAYVGYLTGSSGTVNVGGMASLWNNTGSLTVGNSGSGTMNITGGGAVVNNGAYIGRNNGANIVTVDGKDSFGSASKWTSIGEINVGYSGTGTLNVTGGGSVQNTNGYIGNFSGSIGSAKVDGLSSLWKNTGEIDIGYSGSGTLNVLNGGRVESATGYIGNFSSAAGTANVGAGSTWINSGKLEVGSSGSGSLNITAGSLVQNTDGYIHRFTGGANSVVNVDGKSGNKPSTWTNNGDLYVGYRGTGTGSVNITGGASVSNNNAYIGYSGTTSSGVVTISGDGSIWTSNKGLVVGNEGKGTLNVNDGAQVYNNCPVDIGLNAGSQGIVTVQAAAGLNVDSSMLNFQNFRVGGGGTGTLNVLTGSAVSQVGGTLSILNNGQVNVTGPDASLNVLPSGDTTNGIDVGGTTGLGNLQITAGGTVNGGKRPARIDGSQGTLVKVEGNGSNWQQTSDVTIGRVGYGQLLITGGGAAKFENAATIGFADGSTGEVNVSGAVPNSKTWQVASLRVGVAGTGRLNISGGAQVDSGSTTLGDLFSLTGGGGTATVDGAGSVWKVSNLTIGNLSDGTLNITGGGTVLAGDQSTNVDVYIGKKFGINIGIANVNGSKSQLSVLGDLTVGQEGIGTLNITGGAEVINNDGYIGLLPGSKGTVVVENNSLWINNKGLVIGALGDALLDIRAGGSVIAANDTVVFPRGTVMGNGKLIGNVENFGTIAPGASPGTLHIDGNYSQSDTGKLQIELASTASYDVLAVTGQATLGGTLDITLLGGFLPAPTDTFNILTAASQTGAFDKVTVSATSGNAGTFNVTTTATGLLLTGFKPVSLLLGDFNQDGHLSGADIQAMLAALADLNAYKGATGLSNAGLLSIGDINASGTLTNADVQALLSLLKSGGGSLATVPEPESLLLLALALPGFAFAAVRRRGGSLAYGPSWCQWAQCDCNWAGSSTQYAVQVGDFQWVRIPAGQSVARPEATRAAQGGNDRR